MAISQAHKLNITVIERKDEFIYKQLVEGFVSKHIDGDLSVNNFMTINPSESNPSTIIRFINGGLQGKINKVLILQCSDLKALDCKIATSKSYKGRIPTLFDEMCKLLQTYKNVNVLIPVTNLNKSANAYKKVEKFGTIELFKPMTSKQYVSFVKKRCDVYGIYMNEDTIKYFLDIVDENCAIIDSELNKIALIGDIEIKKSVIRAVVMKSKSAMVFELAKVMGEGRFSRSMELVTELLEQGVSAVQIVALLQRNFRILLYMHCGCDMSEFKLNKWSEQPYKKQCSRFSISVVIDILNKLLEVERLLKSSPISEEFLLAMTILEII